MPLGDLAAGMFEITGRFIGQVIIEFCFEIVIKGPGYLIARLLPGSKSKNSDPDGWLVLVLGIAFWSLVGICAYGIYLFA